MWDILEEISKISLIFQKDAFSISQVKAEIERASEALENMQDNLEDILLPFKKKLGMEQCSRGPVLKGTIQMTGHRCKAKQQSSLTQSNS